MGKSSVHTYEKLHLPTPNSFLKLFFKHCWFQLITRDNYMHSSTLQWIHCYDTTAKARCDHTSVLFVGTKNQYEKIEATTRMRLANHKKTKSDAKINLHVCLNYLPMYLINHFQ